MWYEIQSIGLLLNTTFGKFLYSVDNKSFWKDQDRQGFCGPCTPEVQWWKNNRSAQIVF